MEKANTTQRVYNLKSQTQLALESLDQSQPFWVHLDYNETHAVEWIEQAAFLSETVKEALTSEETRPRAQFFGSGLFVSLRGINLAKSAKPEDMVSIRLYITENCVVSTAHRRIFSVSEIAELINQGEGPKTSSEWLVSMIEHLTDNMSDTVHFIDDKLGDYEDSILTGEKNSFQSELANLRRQIIAIRRHLSPQREALQSLLNDKNILLSSECKHQIRESLDHITRYIEELDSCKERAAVLQEEINVRVGQTMNDRMYVLSIVAAIFLPLGFLTGLLGINVGGIPGTDNPMAFYIFSGLLLVLVIAQVIYFRRNKWVS
ncbi:zinc transporter ZntB [Pseudoalteromonas phenolica]|uniref:zinc transporter ZntB n=1 Tax=Pseudoalteromonas phenolica TaxID=161398 RepID=UPI003850751F